MRAAHFDVEKQHSHVRHFSPLNFCNKTFLFKNKTRNNLNALINKLKDSSMALNFNMLWKKKKNQSKLVSALIATFEISESIDSALFVKAILWYLQSYQLLDNCPISNIPPFIVALTKSPNIFLNFIFIFYTFSTSEKLVCRFAYFFIHKLVLTVLAT